MRFVLFSILVLVSKFKTEDNKSRSRLNTRDWKTDFFYSSGRYSETKRDIGMGHKKYNDGYTYTFLAKISCGAFLTISWSPEVGWGQPIPIQKYEVSQKSVSPTIFEISGMGRSDSCGQAPFRKLWEIHFFVAPHYLAIFFKRGSTSAARNSALNTLYPPLAYTFWLVWTWELGWTENFFWISTLIFCMCVPLGKSRLHDFFPENL